VIFSLPVDSDVTVIARSFDNAEVYAKGQAEEIMGKAFKVI
jgi:predicted oxidoreductase